MASLFQVEGKLDDSGIKEGDDDPNRVDLPGARRNNDGTDNPDPVPHDAEKALPSHQRSEPLRDTPASTTRGDLPTGFYKSVMSANWVRREQVPTHVVCVPEFLLHFSDAATATATATSEHPPTRLFQVWPGNNVFFFRGHVICGPDPRGFLLTAVSIVLCSWMFCVYIGNHPSESSGVVIAFAVLLTVHVLLSLIVVSTRDPGIIPRNMNPPQSDPCTSTSTSSSTRSKRVVVNGVEVKQKYCRVCLLFRPPRSCHCTICNNCVEKFDHHCPWIGQCVGLRNYRFYIMFVYSAFAFFLYIFAFSLRIIARMKAKTSAPLSATLANAPETVALLVFSFVAICFLGGLAIFHGYLVAVNQTARENFKQRYKASFNPYNKGILRNTREALFQKLPLSIVDFRAEVDPSGIVTKANKVSDMAPKTISACSDCEIQEMSPGN